MEFNSAPADPCSNTRRDNVWSEATSSESVETLLKSVGQEEMMPAASIIPGTSVCKDQSGSARHVESDIDLDTRNSDNMGPKNEFHEDPSQNKPLDKQLPLVEVSALNSENAGLSFENPHNLTHNTVSATSFISANEGEHDTEPADENVQEPKTTGCSKLVVLGASEVLATSSDIGSTLDGIHDGSADSSNQHSAELGYFSEPGEVICGSSEQDGLHNLQGQTSDGMETEVDKTSCGSPTIISSSEPSEMETNDLEDAKGSEITEHAIKGSQPTSEDVKGKDLPGNDNFFTFKVNAMPDTTPESETSWSPFHDADKSNPTIVANESIPPCKGKMERMHSPHQSARSTDVESSQGTSKGTHEHRQECKLLFPEGDEKTSSRASLLTDDLEIKTLATSSDIGSTLDGIHDGSADGSNQHSAELGYFSEPEEVICGSSEQDGKLPVCTGNLDPENVKTPTTHLETQSVGEEEVIKGNDGLHNLQGQTSDGMETGTSASSNPAAFTHTQLVQFRAQIDVWVSLCQGTVPDLDSMVLAVGPSDAGEIARPSLWATALERVAATDVAAMEVAATEEEARWAGIEYIDQKLAQQRPAPLPLLCPHLPPLPPWTSGLPRPNLYFLVDTPVKSRFFETRNDMRKQTEFRDYMKTLLGQSDLVGQSDLSFKDAMNMYPLHGFWPDDPDMSLPKLQLPYDPDDMERFRKSDIDGFKEFLLSWPSTNTISEDGTLSLFEKQYSEHGACGLLGQRQYLSCCVNWHQRINIAKRLSDIAQLRSAEIHSLELGRIEFRGLTLGAIHDELDLMGVPRRDLVTRQLPPKYNDVTIMWDVRYWLDGDLRFIYNLYGPNPCTTRDSVVYF